MDFKEYARQDIEDVFLNPEEFGESHTVNGVPGIPVIFDDFELMSREKFKNVQDDSTSRKQSIFYVKAADFGRLPAKGKNVTIDGKNFRVEKAVNEFGVYAITVAAVK